MMTFNEQLISIPYEEKKMSASLFIPSHPNHYGVILTHGAGGDMNHAQLVSFATALAEVGFLVLRFTCKGLNIKYRSKVYLTVLKFLHGYKTPAVRGCLLAGRSMGSRAAVLAANMTLATQLESFVRGVVCLAYPLHTPHKPGELRDEPLKTMKHPCLFVSGSRDKMAKEHLLRNVIGKHMAAEAKLHLIDGANHSYKVAGLKAEVVVQEICDTLLWWCLQKVSTKAASRDCVKEPPADTALRGRVKEPSENTAEHTDKNRTDDFTAVQTGVRSKGWTKTKHARKYRSADDDVGSGSARKRKKVK